MSAPPNTFESCKVGQRRSQTSAIKLLDASVDFPPRWLVEHRGQFGHAPHDLTFRPALKDIVPTTSRRKRACGFLASSLVTRQLETC